MRLGSLLLGPAAAVSSALAVRHPFPELSGIEDGDDDRPALARAAGLFGGLAPVTAAHPVLQSAWPTLWWQHEDRLQLLRQSRRIRPDAATAKIAR